METRYRYSIPEAPPRTVIADCPGSSAPDAPPRPWPFPGESQDRESALGRTFLPAGGFSGMLPDSMAAARGAFVCGGRGRVMAGLVGGVWYGMTDAIGFPRYRRLFPSGERHHAPGGIAGRGRLLAGWCGWSVALASLQRR